MAVTVSKIYPEFEPTASVERSVRIFLNGIEVAVSQATPSDLGDLAVGYLLAEGMLRRREALEEVRVDDEAFCAYVQTAEFVAADRPVVRRVTSAGCAESVLLVDPSASDCNIDSDALFSPEALLEVMESLLNESPRRNDGECVHACAVGGNGEATIVREDIGRHNAMDKAVGAAWLDRIDLSKRALFVTGRISHEMAMKAAKAGVAVLVSHKSATDKAIRYAQRVGLTLVAHCRDDSMDVLSAHDRIADPLIDCETSGRKGSPLNDSSVIFADEATQSIEAMESL